MYEKGEWPDDFNKSVVVPIERKANATQCGDFRTISLIPHASKIVLKILTRRIRPTAKAVELLGKNQFRFRKGRGTGEAIGIMRISECYDCERSLEHDNELFICFVDFEKAFDRVKWTKLWHIPQKIGIDWRDRRLISNLYLQQKTIIRAGNGDTERAGIGRGLRRGGDLGGTVPQKFEVGGMPSALVTFVYRPSS